MGTLPLNARIAAIAKRQNGLITTQQLDELEVGRRQIQSWTAQGRLERMLPGVHRVAGSPPTRDQALQAALLWAGPDALLSHRSAGELWGYDGVRAARPELVVPLAVKKRLPAVVVHRTRTGTSQRRTRRGLAVTTPERTVIDLAGSLRAEPLEVAFESARRERLLTVESVNRAIDELGTRGRRGAEILNAILEALATEPPAESALEVMAARLLRASDLPKPQRPVEVTAFGRNYRLDFAWADDLVALECDGRHWHEAAFERDRRRWSAITRATGYRIVWATWQRIRTEPEQIVAELRLRVRRRRGASSPRCDDVENLDRSATG